MLAGSSVATQRDRNARMPEEIFAQILELLCNVTNDSFTSTC